jgi:hypothetical protein
MAKRHDIKALVKAVDAILDDIRQATYDLGPEWAPGGKWHTDPLADVRWPYPKTHWRTPGSPAKVAMLAFDGEGYDLLSMEAEGHAGDANRERIAAAAEALNFHMEADTNWCDGFYKN